MAHIFKCIKSFVKFSFVFIIMLFAITYLNGRISRPRNQSFYIQKLGEYKPKHNIRKDLKHILIWSSVGDEQFDCLKDEQTVFTENNCIYNNCYVTKNESFLNNDYRNFNAILINGKTISLHKNATFPQKRFKEQLFVFATKESAGYYPICDEKFDSYFNSTWTYRLDSDAAWTYFTIYDKKGKEVGPKLNMNWITDDQAIDNNIENIIFQKTRAVTWFVSHCFTISRRETLFNKLKAQLNWKYNLSVEVFGGCGNLECPQSQAEECWMLLKKYYFYFAFENSLATDYVSEKVVKALLHYTVPVVFGGANYSRFLPPNSFIDVRLLGVERTAAKIAFLISNKSAYKDYFRWHNHYYYSVNTRSVCALCELVNKSPRREYKNFRDWWDPDYVGCKYRNSHKDVMIGGSE